MRAVRATYIKRIDDSQTPKHIDIGLGSNNAFAEALVADRNERLQAIGLFDDKTSTDTGDETPMAQASLVYLNDESGLEMRGIYDLEDDTLTYCWSLPGNPRPSTFSAEKGSQQMLVRLERFSTGEQDIQDQLVEAHARVVNDELGWITGLSFQENDPTIVLALAPALKKLQSVFLHRSHLYADSFQNLAQIESLSNLELSPASITPGLSQVSALPKLRTLSLSGSAITNDVLSDVRELQQITTLRLREAAFTHDGMLQLSGMKLSRIEVDDSPLTDIGLSHLISSVPSLAEISINRAELDGSGFTHLATLPTLTMLRIENTPITDAAAKSIKRAGKLSQLILNNTKITDEGIRQIAEMAEVTQLELNNNSITDKSLRWIAEGLPKLERLTIRGVDAISESGLLELQKHPQLNYLSVSQHKFSREILNKLDERIHVYEH